jgi:DNA polymerase (family 10)
LQVTGSGEHLTALANFATDQGFRLDDDALIKRATGERIRCRDESDVYGTLGLPWIPPELRAGNGEIEAARTQSLPQLIELSDLRGDFHMHCTWSDGHNTLERMIEAAALRGYEYHSISDHSWSRGEWGCDPSELRDQRERVRGIGDRYGIRTLCSAEVDILADGTLDYDDSILAQLDIVVASVHSDMRQSRDAMTARLIRACENRYVNIIGHPTGRHPTLTSGYVFDYDAVFAAAARTGTALEIDGQPGRLDLPSELARHAHELGVILTCDSDAHDSEDLANIELAAGQARRAWLRAPDVLNTWPLNDVLAFVAAKRGG